MTKSKIILSLALISALLFFFGLATDNMNLRLITKAIPVVLLLFLLKQSTAYNKFIMLGLGFSVLGDILLEIPKNLFVFGLVAFLIAHVNYIIDFIKRSKELKPIVALIAYSIGAVIYWILYPNLKEMSIPVAVYMFVILTMVWRSFAQLPTDNFSKFAVLGAIFFAFSDSNIAFNRFYHPYDSARWIIMISYWVAQFFIFWSAFKASEK
jgi:uncharacterized membrane protein YhhN